MEGRGESGNNDPSRRGGKEEGRWEVFKQTAGPSEFLTWRGPGFFPGCGMSMDWM